MSDTPRTDVMVTGNSEPTIDEYEDLATFTRKLERENNELRELVRLLTLEEESDSGRRFHPTTISSCRCMDLDKIGKILEKYK